MPKIPRNGPDIVTDSGERIEGMVLSLVRCRVCGHIYALERPVGAILLRCPACMDWSDGSQFAIRYHMNAALTEMPPQIAWWMQHG